jgi:glycosyltransferase involved in cell wall biosynthesis
MIKVCHIVNLITGRADGVYAHLKMIFQNSDKTKFQHFLIFQEGEKVEREVTALGVKVFVSESLKRKISVKAFLDIYRIIKANEIEIIHTHLVKPYAIAGLVNIILRKKFIFNYHGIFLSGNPYYNFLEILIYRIIHIVIYLFSNVHAVLAPSQKSKELLMEETKLFPEPTVYYNGYNSQSDVLTEQYIVERIQKIKKQGIIIAMVARLEVQKRIDRALGLIKTVLGKRDNVHLLIFGDGDLKQMLIERTKILEIDSKVIFFDYVANISSYYRYFDIVLFTSDWEGMPLTMWEAMANKVPVVAPDVGGFKEILEESNCGLVYEPANMKDAEEKILKLLMNKHLREKLGNNGKMAVEMKYNEKKFITQIEQVYANPLK